MIETNGSSIRIKDMKLSRALLKMWTCLVVVFGVISATSEESVTAFIAATVIVTAVMIAALYCTVALDIGINNSTMFKIIQIVTGVLLAMGLAVHLSVNGTLTFELTLTYAAKLVVLFAATVFVIRVGAQALISGAHMMTDRAETGE